MAALSAFAALVAAYGAEYGFNLRPCILCFYQRYVFYVILAVALFLFLKASSLSSPKRLGGLGLLVALFVGNTGIATYQVLVEQHIVAAPKVCRAGRADTLEGLRKQIKQEAPVPCDKVPWSLFGISIAGFSLLYSLCWALFLAACLNKAFPVKEGEAR